MTGSGSPCGACKFLRRKCVKGCVFAPYFCHEQGAAHFAAIHKVFGASNVAKLLAHLPVSDRCEAAVTISYEAQARLQDPIYGCVSHIFALQQQVCLFVCLFVFNVVFLLSLLKIGFNPILNSVLVVIQLIVCELLDIIVMKFDCNATMDWLKWHANMNWLGWYYWLFYNIIISYYKKFLRCQ